MEMMSQVFPAQDFSLLGLIVGLPVLAAIVCGVFGRRLGKEAVTLMGLTSLFGSFALSVVAFLLLRSQGGDATVFNYRLWQWFTLAGEGPQVADLRTIYLNVALQYDALSGVFAAVVTGTAALMALHAAGSLKVQDKYERHMGYLNGLVCSLLLVFFAQNLVLLVAGWQLAAIFGSLLLGMHDERDKAVAGAVRFAMVQRVGDVALLLGIGLIAYHLGDLSWQGIDAARQQMVGAVKVWPVGDDVPVARLFPSAIAAEVNAPRYVTIASLVGFAVLVAAMSRAGQLFLHVFLTPLSGANSRSIAAVTGLSLAGGSVFLLARCAPLLSLSPAVMFAAAFIGALSTVFGALLQLAQQDAKRALLAGLTAQLGLALVGFGVGSFVDATAWALLVVLAGSGLWLGLGSIIHANQARAAQQSRAAQRTTQKSVEAQDSGIGADFDQLAGMWSVLPRTRLAFMVTALSLVGAPLTTGFVLLSNIVQQSWTAQIKGDKVIGVLGMQLQIPGFAWTSTMSHALLVATALGYVLLTVSSFRVFARLFLGESDSWKTAQPSAWSVARLLDADWKMGLVTHIIATLSVALAVLHVPLLAAVTGAEGFATLSEWLAGSFAAADVAVSTSMPAAASAWGLGLLAVLWALGMGIGYSLFVHREGALGERLIEPSARLSVYFREDSAFTLLYRETVSGALDSLAEACVWLERWIVDGLFTRVPAFLMLVGGAFLRLLSNRGLALHLSMSGVGALLIGYWVMVPRPVLRVHADAASGTYSLIATPGLGYRYRWDSDGDSAHHWDNATFQDQPRVQLSLEPDQTREVRLEIKNAWGWTRATSVTLRRAPSDGVLRLEYTEEGLRRPTTGDEMRAIEEQQEQLMQDDAAPVPAEGE